MAIIIYNLRKPGLIYDSSKLSILGNNVAGSIKKNYKGQYTAGSIVKGKQIKIMLKKVNIETGTYIKSSLHEQSILAGRISNFLNTNGISHDIKVI